MRAREAVSGRRTGRAGTDHRDVEMLHKAKATMAIRSRGCARAAKGNDLFAEKSGAFGAMMTFRRFFYRPALETASGKARRVVVA